MDAKQRDKASHEEMDAKRRPTMNCMVPRVEEEKVDVLVRVKLVCH